MEEITSDGFKKVDEGIFNRIIKARKAMYDAKPLEDKIELEEFVLRLRLDDGHKNAYLSVMKLIKLLSQKIIRDHCG